ncbi:hypothetical protein E2320_000441 [Naja naja]|nr:hypothetical protein E2320_000441 [Naja naja]
MQTFSILSTEWKLVKKEKEKPTTLQAWKGKDVAQGKRNGISNACQPIGLENGANLPAEWFPRSQGPGLRPPNSEVDGSERNFRVNLHCKYGRPSQRAQPTFLSCKNNLEGAQKEIWACGRKRMHRNNLFSLRSSCYQK